MRSTGLTKHTGRPLTVLQLTTSWNASGGIRQAMLLCGALLDEGHRVVFGGAEGSSVFEWASQKGIETLALSFKGPRQKWASSRALRRFALETGADVVHAHHTHGHNLALLATLGGGFPPVIANRGVLFRPVFPLKFRSRRTAAVIVNSERVKTVLAASGVPSSKIHRVYNAKELPDLEDLRSRRDALRTELGIGGSGPVVGSVGSGRSEKGFDHLIAAAPGIVRECPDARFVLIGRGTDRFRPDLEKRGLSGRFVLTGHRTDAWALMAAMDVFVFPSVAMDSCPNVILEALSLELPLVGSDVGGVREILDEGRAGVLVAPGNPGAIAAEVCALLREPARGEALGRAGRLRVQTVFTLEQKVKQTLAVYDRVLGR